MTPRGLHIGSRVNGPALSRFRPCLEALEDRWLPSFLTVTTTADSGSGSLRAELSAAASGDTILFALANPSTIQLTSGTLSIGSTIHVSGPGAAALTLSGNHSFSIFTISATGNATISGLTISGGSASNGGGINSAGSLLLSNCVVTANQATSAGGAIYTAGVATINNCTISSNSAPAGGGIAAIGSTTTVAGSSISANTATTGGGFYVNNALHLANSVVAGNIAIGSATQVVAQGGGIYGDTGGQITIFDSSIMGNSATGVNAGLLAGNAYGGGISANCPSTILDSTIANNTGTGAGGGTNSGAAYGGGLYFQTSFTLSNCTVSGNRATSGANSSGVANFATGGGASWFFTTAQTATLFNCTINQNVAAIQALAASGHGEGGGLSALGPAGTVNLQNTIVAANSATDAQTDFLNQAPSTNAAYNLIGDGTGSGITNGSNGNKVGTTQSPINPKFGGLNNYGGPTATVPLLPGSPAIDAGSNNIVLAPTDQRGLPRIVNGRVDIGAFEVQPLHLLAAGADLGGAPEVKVFDATTGLMHLDFNAYESSFKGGVRVAVADMNGDGMPDIITAPGGVKVTLVNVNGALVPSFDLSAGRAPEIKIFSGTDGTKLADFLAYPSSFTAGVFVAVANVSNDTMPDIITGPEATGQSGHTNVRVFFNGHFINTGGPFAPDREFNAYDPGFGGGVRLATADLNGDGFADIVTAPGIWSGPDIRVFDGRTLFFSSTASKIGEFLAYDYRYFGGVFVATGDTNGDGAPDIISGTNGNGGPEVKAFNGLRVLSSPTPPLIDDFFAYAPAFNGGARVAALDVNGDGKADIITGAGPGGTSHVRIFDGGTGLQLQNSVLDSFIAFDVLFSGGVFVGAG